MLRHKAFNECRERLFLPKVAVHHQGRGKGVSHNGISTRASLITRLGVAGVSHASITRSSNSMEMCGRVWMREVPATTFRLEWWGQAPQG